MRCPRCGGDNPERAERCYLCEYPFAASAGMAEPPSPDEALRAQYPPPPPPEGQAVPPPPITGQGGYQPPPPGAYPGGYQPPPPVPGSSPTVKIIIGSLVLVLIVILGVGGYFFLRGKNYSIEVPAPPGYGEPGEEVIEAANESLQAENDDVKLDYLFERKDGTSFVFVVHQKFFLTELPPDDPEEAQEYYMQHKEELMNEMSMVQDLGFSGGVEVTDYETVTLNTGDTALHMGIEMNFQQVSMTMDMLLVVKGKTMFMVIVQGLGTSTPEETLDFLKENITFKG